MRRRTFLTLALVGALLGACGTKLGPSDSAPADAPTAAPARPASAPPAPDVPGATVTAQPSPKEASPKEASPKEATPPTPRAEERLATFGGGCFWCTEAVFLRLKGVLGVESGYSGGKTQNPTYRQVSEGDTGHAEVIQVRYDPAQVSYDTLLEVFFATHDPTTKDRQGNDWGTQYRSIILTHDDEQRRAAEAAKKRLDDGKEYPAPVVTQIVPFERFWKAETYHQDYFAQNPAQGYCRAVVSPKVHKFEKAFKDRLK